MRALFTLLFLLALSDQALHAQPIYAQFTLHRTRHAAEIQSEAFQFTVHFNLADLPHGPETVATLHGSGSPPSYSQSVEVSIRGDRGIFSFRVSINLVDDVNDTWHLTVSGIDSPNNQYAFTLTNVSHNAYPPYPAFAMLNYNDAYDQVFVPHVSTPSYGTSRQDYGHSLSSASVSGGTVLTYPVGGPFRLDTSHSSSMAAFPIKNDDDVTVRWVSNPEARSFNVLHLNISEVPLSNASTIGGFTGGFRFVMNGLLPGNTYHLCISEDLTNWDCVHTFTAASNVFVYDDTDLMDINFYKFVDITPP